MYGVDLLRAQRGLISWLAPRLGISQPALSKWSQIPAERALKIEKITGIPRHLLRPDLWTPPWGEEEGGLHTRRKNISKTSHKLSAEI